MSFQLSRTLQAINYLIALLVLTASLLGLYDPTVYARETENWAMQAKGQDLGNLIAVIVLILSSSSISVRSVNAFLIWMGTLFYFIYAYLLYVFAVHFNYLFLLYVAILGLSFYTLIGALIGRNFEILMKLSFRKARSASIVLMMIGSLFLILWLTEIVPALIAHKIPNSTLEAGLLVNPVHALDLSIVLPGMVLTGIMLWRGSSLGRAFAAPWLAFSVLMGSSIVILMIMEMLDGNLETIPPLIMMVLVVLASLIVLISYLRSNEHNQQ